MGWIVWLVVPVALTSVVAVLSWYRSRPVRRRGTVDAMQAHSDYLDALVQPARSRDRRPR